VTTPGPGGGGGHVAGRVYYVLGLDDRQMRTQLQASQAHLRTAGATGQQSLGQIQQGANQATNSIKTLATGLAGLGAMKIGVEAFQELRSFDKSMQGVFALAPKSSADMRAALTDDAERLSIAYGKAADEIGNAFELAIGSGISVGQAAQYTEVAARAAVAGNTDVKTTVDALTTATNTYAASGLTAQQAADSMFKAVALGKGEFGQYAAKLSEVLPIANSLGMTMDDMTGAMAAMSLQGTPVSQAATSIRASLAELSRDGTKAGDAFREQTGMSVREYVAAGHSYYDVMQQMHEQAQVAGVGVETLFSQVEGGAAALQLTGGAGETFSNIMTEMTFKMNATSDAFAEAQESIDFKFNVAMQEMKAGLREAAVEIVPLVQNGMDLAGSAIEWGKAHKDGLTAIVATTAALILMRKAVVGLGVVNGAIAASQLWVLALKQEAAFATYAGAANNKLLLSRTLLARAGAGGVMVAGAAIVGGGYQAAKGAGDGNLFDYNKDVARGGDAGARVLGGAQQMLHTVRVFDDYSGYNDAQKYAQISENLDDQRLKAAQSKRNYAQMQDYAAKLKSAAATRDLTRAESELIDVVNTGHGPALTSAREDFEKLAEQIAKTRDQYASSVDMFGDPAQRFKKATPEELEGLTEAAADARRGVEDRQARLNELRASGSATARDLADAERDLAKAAKAARDAEKKEKDGRDGVDRSLSGADLLGKAKQNAAAQETLAADINTLAKTGDGLTPSALEGLLDVEKKHPGTIRRIVQEGVTDPYVEALNAQYGSLESAASMIANALNGQVKTLREQQVEEAREHGRRTIKAMVEGQQEAYDQMMQQVHAPKPGEAGFIGPVAGQAGPPQPGADYGLSPKPLGPGIFINNMEVKANNSRELADWGTRTAANNNLAGGR
jgi:hypothetical protein